MASSSDRPGNWTIGARFAARQTGGFDYLRLILSLIVILYHSHGIAMAGTPHHTPYFWLFARIAVPLFFALSGFLVASSLDRAATLRVFLTNRLLRIFPALTIEVALSALVLGPLMTSLAVTAYFNDPQFHAYFLNIVGYIHYYLPGVFADRLPHEVNRSLWTVPFEFECYVLLSLLYVFGMFRRTGWLAAALIGLTAFCLWQYRAYDYGVAPTVPGRLVVAYFLAGNIVYKLRDRLPGGGAVAWALVALSYLMLTNVAATMLSPLVVAYAAAALGCTAPRKLPYVFSGDYSYGLYLYAMPIQQTVRTLFGPLATLPHFLLSLIFASAFAVFSWHVIEKPALRLKRYFSGERPVRVGPAEIDAPVGKVAVPARSG